MQSKSVLFWFVLLFLPYPDFGDGLLNALAVDLPEGDGVKLSLVEVRHCPVTSFLTQGLGCLERVLKIAPKMQRNIY